MISDLRKCFANARDMKRKAAELGYKAVSFQELMRQEWLILYPDSTLTGKNLQTRLYFHDKKLKERAVKRRRDLIQWCSMTAAKAYRIGSPRHTDRHTEAGTESDVKPSVTNEHVQAPEMKNATAVSDVDKSCSVRLVPLKQSEVHKLQEQNTSTSDLSSEPTHIEHETDIDANNADRAENDKIPENVQTEIITADSQICNKSLTANDLPQVSAGDNVFERLAINTGHSLNMIPESNKSDRRPKMPQVLVKRIDCSSMPPMRKVCFGSENTDKEFVKDWSSRLLFNSFLGKPTRNQSPNPPIRSLCSSSSETNRLS